VLLVHQHRPRPGQRRLCTPVRRLAIIGHPKEHLHETNLQLQTGSHDLQTTQDLAMQDINRRTARDSDNPGHPIPTSTYITHSNGRLKSPADTDPRQPVTGAVPAQSDSLPLSLHSTREAACSRFCRCRIPADPPSAPLLCCRRVTKAMSRQRRSVALRPGVMQRPSV
jgi:hypothetical protein